MGTKHLVAIAAVALGMSPPLAAQYPTKPIRVLVADQPGSAPDTITRLLGEKVGPLLGQPIVTETRTGSNGIIAMEAAARSAADGYTLVFVADSMVVINPHIYTRIPIDTLRDLVPVSAVAAQNNFYLSVHPSVPVKSFQEFIEYAKNAKTPLAYASAGNGSQHQMAMEMLKQRAGISLLHVPYRGGAPAAAATMAGDVQAMFSAASTAPQIKSGKLRGLASTGPARSPIFPELPTIAEFYPGYRLTTWLGLFGPAALPEQVLARLRGAIHQALATQEMKDRLGAAGGLEPYIATPQEFGERIRADHEKYGKLIKEVGIKID